MAYENIDGLFVSDSTVDLMPSERLDVKQAITAEANSAQTVSAFSSADNANDMERAAQGFSIRLRSRLNELGFQAFISADIKNEDNWDMFDNGTMMWTPKVQLLGRMSKKTIETDYDKLQWQCQHGLADGKVGKFKNGRDWTDDVDKTSVLF